MATPPFFSNVDGKPQALTSDDDDRLAAAEAAFRSSVIRAARRLASEVIAIERERAKRKQTPSDVMSELFGGE